MSWLSSFCFHFHYSDIFSNILSGLNFADGNLEYFCAEFTAKAVKYNPCKMNAVKIHTKRS